MKKTVLITGASRGIGKAIALAFAGANYNLALCCRHNETLLMALAEQLCVGYDSQVLTFTGDVSDSAFVNDMIQETIRQFGSIQVLVNNAGISYLGLLSDMSDAQWHSVMDTNLSSVFYCCRGVIPSMVHQKSGRIINISSVWGCSGASCEAAYSASKGAVNAFTQALAKELAPSNIQVNAIACGTIDTEMNGWLSPEDKASLEEEIPAGRFGLPEEVGRLALQLADAPEYLTAQIIRLDGGWL